VSADSTPFAVAFHVQDLHVALDVFRDVALRESKPDPVDDALFPSQRDCGGFVRRGSRDLDDVHVTSSLNPLASPWTSNVCLARHFSQEEREENERKAARGVQEAIAIAKANGRMASPVLSPKSPPTPLLAPVSPPSHQAGVDELAQQERQRKADEGIKAALALAQPRVKAAAESKLMALEDAHMRQFVAAEKAEIKRREDLEQLRHKAERGMQAAWEQCKATKRKLEAQRVQDELEAAEREQQRMQREAVEKAELERKAVAALKAVRALDQLRRREAVERSCMDQEEKRVRFMLVEEARLRAKAEQDRRVAAGFRALQELEARRKEAVEKERIVQAAAAAELRAQQAAAVKARWEAKLAAKAQVPTHLEQRC
jgi:hypothetical protein